MLTEGVVPSLHVEDKKSKVKPYHKEGQALRTETTINDTYDFEIGRALHNLPALREIGFTANRRLLHVESLSHDCLIGEDDLDAPDPIEVIPAEIQVPGSSNGQHARPLPLNGKGHRRPVHAAGTLTSEASAGLRDQMLAGLATVGSSQAMTDWAQRSLPTKGNLAAADARAADTSTAHTDAYQAR